MCHAPRFLTTHQAPLTRWSNSLTTLHQVCNDWSTTNFSLQYPYIVKQTGNENEGNDLKETVSWYTTKFSELTLKKCIAIILDNLYLELGLLVFVGAHGTRNCCFSYNFFVYSLVTCTFTNTLKFVVKDCDPSTGEPDEEGYEDEYVVCVCLPFHFFHNGI